MQLIILLVLSCSCTLSLGDVELPGHLQRLGLQMKGEGHIDILTKLPSPLKFYDDYVKPGRPAVFKGAAKPMPAFQNWNDDYLKTKFANLKFDVEEGKKENRSMRSFVYSMKDFVDKYKTEDVYMVHSIQPEMRDDVTLLPSISCGGYVNLLQDIVVWFSSGGTSSVLHTDGVDNLNCLFSGNKELYMVNKMYAEHIPFDAPSGSHSNVDPDAVDLTKYPGLGKAPWWDAKMEAGDCLFIPIGWFHQVRSYGRNIAVNVWFTHPNQVNETDCEGKDWQSQYVPLSNYKLKSNAGAQQMLALEVKAKGKMSRRAFTSFLAEHLSVDRSQAKEIFNLVNKNKDKYVTMEDIDILTDADLKYIRQLMPMGADYEGGSEEGEDAYPEGGSEEGEDTYPEDGSEEGGADGEQGSDDYDSEFAADEAPAGDKNTRTEL